MAKNIATHLSPAKLLEVHLLISAGMEPLPKEYRHHIAKGDFYPEVDATPPILRYMRLLATCGVVGYQLPDAFTAYQSTIPTTHSNTHSRRLAVACESLLAIGTVHPGTLRAELDVRSRLTRVAAIGIYDALGPYNLNPEGITPVSVSSTINPLIEGIKTELAIAQATELPNFNA